MIQRYYLPLLESALKPGKVLLIYGPRRSGKTTLLQSFLKNYSGTAYFGTGDDRAVREILSSERVERIKTAFSGYNCIVIDEAQRIPNVGLGLKIMVDSLPHIPVIASGSSSFELANQIGEPLTGRKKTIHLFPFSVGEITNQFGAMKVHEHLENLLLFGLYPEVFTAENRDDKIDYLHELKEAYLFKDILMLENIRNPQILQDLLRMLAFQIGKDVSLNELSNGLGIAKQTVQRYIDLLMKVFVIKRVGGFSKNLRKEITKTARYYFIDNGIRNAVINNFSFPESRNDMGMLWENFMFSERMKYREHHGIRANIYFWRTYSGQEIDMIEEREGLLYGYEFKWGTKRIRPPRLWQDTYPNSKYSVVNTENYLTYLL